MNDARTNELGTNAADRDTTLRSSDPVVVGLESTVEAARRERAGRFAGQSTKAGAFVCAFVVVMLGASFVKPPPRSASASLTPSSQPQSQVSQAQLQDHTLHLPQATGRFASPVWQTTLRSMENAGVRVLGMVEGREFVVIAVAGVDAPTYSVFTLEGVELKSGLLADEVYREFPGLELPALQGVMLADTP